jgi:hypothetical protein
MEWRAPKLYVPIVAVIWDTFLTMVLRWRDSDLCKNSYPVDFRD